MQFFESCTTVENSFDAQFFSPLLIDIAMISILQSVFNYYQSYSTFSTGIYEHLVITQRHMHHLLVNDSQFAYQIIIIHEQ